MRALRRAYAQARISPATVGLVEAHGTGTVAGDGAEVKALSTVFAEHSDQRQWCAIGSVKSMIGHTKATAGVAGIDQGRARAAPSRAAADDRRERAEPQGRLPREPLLRQQRGAAVADRRRAAPAPGRASAPSASAAPTSTSCSRSTPAATSSSPRRRSRAGPPSCCCGAGPASRCSAALDATRRAELDRGEEPAALTKLARQLAERGRAAGPAGARRSRSWPSRSRTCARSSAGRGSCSPAAPRACTSATGSTSPSSR